MINKLKNYFRTVLNIDNLNMKLQRNVILSMGSNP